MRERQDVRSPTGQEMHNERTALAVEDAVRIIHAVRNLKGLTLEETTTVAHVAATLLLSREAGDGLSHIADCMP